MGKKFFILEKRRNLPGRKERVFHDTLDFCDRQLK